MRAEVNYHVRPPSACWTMFLTLIPSVTAANTSANYSKRLSHILSSEIRGGGGLLNQLL